MGLPDSDVCFENNLVIIVIVIIQFNSILRIVDAESVDVASSPLDIQALVDRLHGLFGPDRLALTTPGYTKYMTDLLQQGNVSYIVKGQVHRLRLPNAAATMDRLFHRMGCWMKLVMEVLRTEWPDYTLFASLGIFGLAKTTAKTTMAVTEFSVDDTTCAKRLAKAFGVNEHGLYSELQRLRPMASRSLADDWFIHYLFNFLDFLFSSVLSLATLLQLTWMCQDSKHDQVWKPGSLV